MRGAPATALGKLVARLTSLGPPRRTSGSARLARTQPLSACACRACRLFRAFGADTLALLAARAPNAPGPPFEPRRRRRRRRRREDGAVEDNLTLAEFAKRHGITVRRDPLTRRPAAAKKARTSAGSKAKGAGGATPRVAVNSSASAVLNTEPWVAPEQQLPSVAVSRILIRWNHCIEWPDPAEVAALEVRVVRAAGASSCGPAGWHRLTPWLGDPSHSPSTPRRRPSGSGATGRSPATLGCTLASGCVASRRGADRAAHASLRARDVCSPPQTDVIGEYDVLPLSDLQFGDFKYRPTRKHLMQLPLPKILVLWETVRAIVRPPPRPWQLAVRSWPARSRRRTTPAGLPQPAAPLAAARRRGRLVR